MTERETLAKIIYDAVGTHSFVWTDENGYAERRREVYRRIADAVLEAGYRQPIPTVQ